MIDNALESLIQFSSYKYIVYDIECKDTLDNPTIYFLLLL